MKISLLEYFSKIKLFEYFLWWADVRYVWKSIDILGEHCLISRQLEVLFIVALFPRTSAKRGPFILWRLTAIPSLLIAAPGTFFTKGESVSFTLKLAVENSSLKAHLQTFCFYKTMILFRHNTFFCKLHIVCTSQPPKCLMTDLYPNLGHCYILTPDRAVHQPMHLCK